MPPVTVKREQARQKTQPQQRAQKRAQQGDTPSQTTAATNVPGGQRGETGYNFALVCGNRVEIFPPEKFHEIQEEVERFLSQGRLMEEVSISLLESDDPWK